MKNKIQDLRDHLFATIESLRDADKPMEIERARAISDVAQTIINSAKVEVDAMKLVGGPGTGFIPVPDRKQVPPPAPPGQRLGSGK